MFTNRNFQMLTYFIYIGNCGFQGWLKKIDFIRYTPKNVFKLTSYINLYLLVYEFQKWTVVFDQIYINNPL